jgi:hypothetical protein
MITDSIAVKLGNGDTIKERRGISDNVFSLRTHPSSANLIAGPKTSAMVTFPLPNLSTVLSQASAAPNQTLIQ